MPLKQESRGQLHIAINTNAQYNSGKGYCSRRQRGAHIDEYVEVFAASDITFAYLMKANLGTGGIPVQITNEHLQGVYCFDGMVPCVLVPATHAEQARRIIEEIQQSSQDDQDDDEQEE